MAPDRDTIKRKAKEFAATAEDIGQFLQKQEPRLRELDARLTERRHRRR